LNGGCIHIYIHAGNVHDKCSCKCSGLFRIAAADQRDQTEDSDVQDGSEERGSKVDKGYTGKNHAESHDPEIVSPAVYVTTFSAEAIN
jgi:hypothetical protein